MKQKLFSDNNLIHTVVNCDYDAVSRILKTGDYDKSCLDDIGGFSKEVSVFILSVCYSVILNPEDYSEDMPSFLKEKHEENIKILSLFEKQFGFKNDNIIIEDFVQDVFFKAYKNLSSFRGESKFSTWLTSIAYTTAINAKNRKKEYETLSDEAMLPDLDSTPEERQIRTLTKQAVREAIKELPEDYAFCLDLYFFYDNSYEEIMIITGKPLNTIKSHIFRAKKILREKLADFYNV